MSSLALPSYNTPTKRISVGLLGCTGVVGQKFISLLSIHPWFQLTHIAASERSAGQTYEVSE